METVTADDATSPVQDIPTGDLTLEGDTELNDKTPSVCAVDIGRSYTKVWMKGRHFMFPSVYGYPKNSYGFDAGMSPFGDKGEDGKRVLEFEGEQYLVGDDASHLRDATFLSDVDSIVKYSPLFVAKALDSPARGDKGKKVHTLCLGLPLADYAKRKDALKARCRKFKVGGLGGSPTREFSFERIVTYAQGTGPLFEHLNRYPNDKNIVVVEMGFFTLDCLLTQDGKVVDSDFRDDKGVNELAKKIHAWVYNQTGVDASLYKIQEVLQQGDMACIANRYSKLNGELRKAVAQLTTRYTNEVVQHIKQRFGQSLKVTDRIVLAGGGANCIREEALDTDLKDFVHVMKDPEYSNARGWFMTASKAK
ncbi:MAG: ParM/StbA family protein [Thermodesulfovibrionales bacterium]